jgi:NitT/TauT family transport system ATP-binding protein
VRVGSQFMGTQDGNRVAGEEIRAPRVELQGVGKRFAEGEPILRGIDLSVEPGSFVAILGESGSGKSTLLRMLADLELPSEGSIRIGGQSPAEYLSHTAFVFQEATLLPWQRVLANVELPLRIRGVNRQERRERARAWLAKVGLADAANHYPRQLSGGMRMRVSLARMLVRSPGLMLFDEPFSALDEVNRQYLNELLSALYMQERWTGLFVTHSVSEALFLASRVLVIGGKPARIVGDFTLPWTFPRTAELRNRAEYFQWGEKLSNVLRETRVTNEERRGA